MPPAAFYGTIKDSIERQLHVVLSLLLVRSLLDEDAPVPASLVQQQCDIRFDGETSSSAGWTAIEVVRSMGDRFEAWPTSGFVKAVTAMVAAAHTEACTNLFPVCLCHP